MKISEKHYSGGWMKNKIRKVGYGLENKKSYAEWWRDDMRMMYAVCTEFGIKYWAILQPNMYMEIIR